MHTPIQLLFLNTPNETHQQPAKQISNRTNNHETHRTQPYKPRKANMQQNTTRAKRTENFPLFAPTTKRTARGKYKKQTRQIIYNQTRATTINHQEGLNTLYIASLNPDHFAPNEAQNDIIQQVSGGNTHRFNPRNTHTAKPHLQKKKLRSNNNITRKTKRACNHTGKGLHQGGYRR